jgi:mycothiol synthase
MTTDSTTVTGAAVDLDRMPPIPGLGFRLFRDADDWTAIADVIRAAHIFDGDPYAPTSESLRVEAEHRSGFDLGRDVLLAEVDGRVVAVAQGVATIRDERPVHQVDGSVDPAWRRRGIGRAMLDWNERRARTLATAEPAYGGPAAEIGSWLSDSEHGAVALFTGAGYVPRRYGFGMIRRTLDDVVELPLPDGLEIRPVRPNDHRTIWAADDEAFQDHPEHRRQDEEDFVALFAEPEIDTSLWRVAWDGEEVAGAVLTWIWRSENEVLGVRRGWLERISTRRPWRRRGLARALITSALVGLRDAGMTDAMLGVDAQNPTGALALYESVGFEVKDRAASYRKLLGA